MPGDKVAPVIAKTDFALQQQMVGFTKCKDLEDWLMGSGESAETADSKAQEPKKAEFGEWMFKTFDQGGPLKREPQKEASKLDPFEDCEEDDVSDQSDDDFMLGGGMHLLNKPKAPDYVG